MDGVEPENVNAALLPVSVAEVNDGVEVTPKAPDVTVRFDPVRSVTVSPFNAIADSSAAPLTLSPEDRLTPEVTVKL